MSFMGQSSKAQDRTLGVWFQNIEQGAIKLPRFQRFEAWDRSRITSFLNTIINNLPVGVTLVLEVAGQEKFVSRYISTADPRSAGTVTQHLLDGQQRLTAFWRSMHNNYEWEAFFVYVPRFDRSESLTGSDIEVRCIPRYLNKREVRMPRWADEPAECFERGLFPVSLLRPGDITTQIDEWLRKATAAMEPSEDAPDAFNKLRAYVDAKNAVKDVITTLRERVAHFNLPFLSLPPDTDKDVALQVFINMNTNSKPLSLYDLIVAEVENVSGRSLHDLEMEIESRNPKVARYIDVSDLILTTSALLQDKSPNAKGILEADKIKLLDNWPKLERGLASMVTFLENQGIFDAQRLPTNSILPVIAALFNLIPDDGDFRAKGEKLLRRYLWSSFFTDRYENAAATRAYADFRELASLLRNPSFADEQVQSVPVLNRREYPLPDEDSLMSAGWPKAAGIEARAILAVTTYLGAIDFADNQPATYESIQKREYHHVFPDALLSEVGIKSFLALNCALITWKTNRIIGRKDPLEYLQERVRWADDATVRERLKSHLISFDLLASAHYIGLQGDELKAKLLNEFDEFLRDRARLVTSAMTILTDGGEPILERLWADHLAEPSAARSA